MKESFFILVAVGLIGCAHQSRTDLALAPPLEPAASVAAVLPELCLPRALSAVEVGSDPQTAFKNYYEAFLDVKEQSKYVDCLSRRWRVPWLHAEYRRGRRWLKDSQRIMARNEPLAGKDERISDVVETFEPKDSGHTLRRVTITLANGSQRVVEETFPNTPAGS